jgi:hypothetical protein
MGTPERKVVPRFPAAKPIWRQQNAVLDILLIAFFTAPRRLRVEPACPTASVSAACYPSRCDMGQQPMWPVDICLDGDVGLV